LDEGSFRPSLLLSDKFYNCVQQTQILVRGPAGLYLPDANRVQKNVSLQGIRLISKNIRGHPVEISHIRRLLILYDIHSPSQSEIRDFDIESDSIPDNILVQQQILAFQISMNHRIRELMLKHHPLGDIQDHLSLLLPRQRMFFFCARNQTKCTPLAILLNQVQISLCWQTLTKLTRLGCGRNFNRVESSLLDSSMNFRDFSQTFKEILLMVQSSPWDSPK
jgi:hypothetical protein